MAEGRTEYALEPEFHASPPRPMPPFVYRGRYLKRQRKSQRALLIAAVLCAGAQFVPVVQALAVYMLPLGYIGWIGVALMVAYLVSVASVLRGGGVLRYATDAETLPVEVTGLTKQPSVVVNGQESQFAFVVTARAAHPDSGEIVTVEIHSDNYSVYEKVRRQTTLRVGDTVTALYLPGDFEGSLRLYGFLGLNPAVDYVPEMGEIRPLLETAAIAGAVALTVALALSLYTMERYTPLEFPLNGFVVAVAAGGALAGLAAVAAGYGLQRRWDRARDTRNAAALDEGAPLEVGVPVGGRWAGFERRLYSGALLIGVPILFAIVTVCSVLFANGYLDRSVPARVPAHIGERYTETHALVFRQYKVDFILEGEEKERTLSTSPAHLQRLGHHTTGEALIRAGYFGWPWIETLDVPDPPV